MSVPMLLRRTLTVVVGLLLALATVEAIARRYAYTPAGGDTKWWHREGNAESHWRRGIRLPISESSARRVLVLGDSFAAAQHVADEETFCFLAERGLRARGRDVALLNAGSPGANLADHVFSGPSLALRERADWTVVVVTDDDLGAPSWQGASYFAWEGSQLQVKRAGKSKATTKNRLSPLRGRSALVQNAYLQYKGLREMASAWHPFTATPPPRTERARSYPVADEMLLTRDAFAGRVTLLHLGVSGSTVSPTERLFRATCEQRALSCITTREQLAELRATGTPPQGFPNSGWDVGHLNQHGHRTVAAVLVDRIADGLF